MISPAQKNGTHPEAKQSAQTNASIASQWSKYRKRVLCCYPTTNAGQKHRQASRASRPAERMTISSPDSDINPLCVHDRMEITAFPWAEYPPHSLEDDIGILVPIISLTRSPTLLPSYSTRRQPELHFIPASSLRFGFCFDQLRTFVLAAMLLHKMKKKNKRDRYENTSTHTQNWEIIRRKTLPPIRNLVAHWN